MRDLRSPADFIMSDKRVLIVEDDEDILEMISYNLGKDGFAVSSVLSGDEAQYAASHSQPDLIVLDIMLPVVDGLEVLKSLRSTEDTKHIPVIMLSAKSRESDKVVGLELGADDYMTKPFSPRELVARIKAILRRLDSPVKGSPKELIQNIISGALEIDTVKHLVKLSGEPLSLTNTEFRMLMLMAGNPGEVFSRQRILDEVFGYQADVYGRTVDTHIKTLRKKFGPSRGMIETVRGAGYRFCEQPVMDLK